MSIPSHVARPIAAPSEGTRITLLGRDGELPWRPADGMLHIDLGGVSAGQIAGGNAWTLRLHGYLVGPGSEHGNRRSAGIGTERVAGAPHLPHQESIR